MAEGRRWSIASCEVMSTGDLGGHPWNWASEERRGAFQEGKPGCVSECPVHSELGLEGPWRPC